MSEEKKLFLIDGHAMLYRSYFAFIKNPRISASGVNTSGIFGFTNTLLELLRIQNPSHIGVVFDPQGPTFRNDMYAEYKATRQETPEDLKASIPHLIEIIQGFNIPVIQVEGFEADDVIGTLAKQAAQDGFTVYMATPDKDYCQLVDEHIYMYRPRSFGKGIEILGIPEVLEKFGVENTAQVIDILGLWGDSSDNVPGAPGIGEKTSKKLISEYGSIEGLYDHIDELKGKQKEKLIEHKEQVLLSKKLVTIDVNVPITFSSYNFSREEYNQGILLEKFKELEFNNIAQRLFAPVEPSPQKKQQTPPSQQLDLFGSNDSNPGEFQSLYKTIKDTDHSYYLVDTPSLLKDLIHKLSQLDAFCFDTETTSLSIIDAELCGISFSWEAHKAYYVPFPENQNEAQKIADALQPVFSSKACKIGQNVKYDISVLANYRIEVSGTLFDTLLAHYIIQPDGRHKLDALSQQYLEYEMVHIEELIGKKGATQASFRTVPLEQAKEYACEDADITFQLYSLLLSELQEKNQLELFEQIEVPLVPVLSDMERIGVSIDSEALHSLSASLKESILEIQQQIFDHAGEEFNIDSPKQLGTILFDKMAIVEKAKKTKTKQYATGEEVLQKLTDTHPIVELILDYRELKKLLTTYVDALPKLVHPKTHKIHTSFNQAIVTTGRLSSTNPNLQNIPIKTEKGREIRKAFVPSDSEHVFVSADYSQIELRVIAHMSGDPHFIEAFTNEEDIHTATAAKIFKVSPKEVSSEQRRQAKSANFAIAYGTTAFGLSQTLSIPRKDAQALIDSYFESYPKVKEFMDEQIQKAQKYGYVETMFGRRRYLPDIHSQNATVRGFAERNAINAPIQGTAADIMKKAMIEIYRTMREKKMQSKLIMQVHDELNFDVAHDELESMQKIIQDGMQNVVELSVPLSIEMGVGANWLEAH
ncbi:MAG: DNA polymerase I [Bacteroidota bacterium]